MAAQHWHELRSSDFTGLDPERAVALLPVGAVEQHGPHLPVGVDALINRGIVEAALPRVAGDVQLLVLPMTWVGRSEEHVDFPGTLTLSAETLQRVWREIGASVARAGVRKLLILNSHGGQIQTMQIVARELRIACGMLVVACSWPQLGLPDGLVDAEEARFGIHAGDVETSLMLALAPALVDMSRAADFVPLTRRLRDSHPILIGLGAAGFGWQAQDLHPAGACGDATRASAERGRTILAHVGGRLAALVAEIASVDLAVLRDGPMPAPDRPA
jgi:creatinine amidohydrolase